jgi:predicted nucleic acid-binding protein
VTRIFADTFYFLALFNPRDAAHSKAISIAKTLAGTLLTTDWVLVEVADALCDPTNRAACGAMIDDLRASASVEVVPATRASFDAGWSLYRTRADKDWSLTDCISFAVMKECGIGEALTGDRHFVQAGFAALLI